MPVKQKVNLGDRTSYARTLAYNGKRQMQKKGDKQSFHLRQPTKNCFGMHSSPSFELNPMIYARSFNKTYLNMFPHDLQSGFNSGRSIIEQTAIRCVIEACRLQLKPISIVFADLKMCSVSVDRFVTPHLHRYLESANHSGNSFIRKIRYL